MAIKGIIKNSITSDIDAKQFASMFDSLYGKSGICQIYDKLALTKIDDNTVRLAPGIYSLQGYIVMVENGTTEDFIVDSGTSGLNRKDLLVAEFSRNAGGVGIDTLTFKIIKGTSDAGAPSDPTLTEQDLSDVGTLRQEALYRINIVGISLDSIEKIAVDIEDINNLSYIGDRTYDEDNFVTDEETITNSINALDKGVEVLKYNNAGSHNSIYRGKYLGNTYTAEQKAMIDAGTFDDLYVGDYWTIGGVNWRIAGFDYYYNVGDTALTQHHAVIVPDTTLYNAQMNTSDITTGGYVGSLMRTNNLATAIATIETAFGVANVLSHNQLLVNATTDGKASGWVWTSGKVELMNEAMVYGTGAWGVSIVGNGYNIASSNGRLPLFNFRQDLVNTSQSYWLRDVVSSTYFAFVYGGGFAGYGSASSSHGVRPAFSIS